MFAYLLARILCFVMVLFNVDFYDSFEDDDADLYGSLEDYENNTAGPDEYSQKIAEYNGNYCFEMNQLTKN